MKKPRKSSVSGKRADQAVRRQPRATTIERTAATGDPVAERYRRRHGIANAGARGSKGAGVAVGERVTTAEMEAAIAARLAQANAPSLRAIAAEFAVNRSVVERIRDSAVETAPSIALVDPASRDATNDSNRTDNANDIPASDGNALRATAAAASLRAVPIKARIRVLKRAMQSADLRIALAAVQALNDLSDIGGKGRDIVPVDTRPLFALPQRAAPGSEETSQVPLPVDIAPVRG